MVDVEIERCRVGIRSGAGDSCMEIPGGAGGWYELLWVTRARVREVRLTYARARESPF